MSRKSIRSRIEELENGVLDETDHWIASMADKLPEREGSTCVFVIDDTRNGEPVFANPERVVRRGEGVIEACEGANTPEPPEHYTHVASGPEGVTSDVVHHWQLYADLSVHTPPESVATQELPVELALISHATE